MQTVPAGFDISKRFSGICYFLVILAVLGFCSAPEQENYSLLILAVMACTMSWFMVEGPKGTPLPRIMVNIGVLTTSLILLGELLFSAHPSLLIGLGHFMTGIVLCKLFERKTGRDYIQILALSLLIMVAGAIFSAWIVFAIFLSIFLLLGLYSLFLLHLRIETDVAGASGPLGAMYVPLAEQPYIRRDMRRVSTWAIALLSAVAVTVFLLMPRSPGQGFLSSWSLDTTVQTGFSQTVQFHENGQMLQSDAVVMDVKIEQNGINIGSESYQPYFRGVVLDAYDAGRKQWVRDDSHGIPPPESHDVNRAEGELISSALYNDMALITQEYTLHSYTDNVLFTIAPAVSLVPDRIVNIQYDEGTRDIIGQSNLPATLKYTVNSAAVYKPSLWKGEPSIIPGSLGTPPDDQQFGRWRQWRRGWDDGARTTVPKQITQLARKVASDLLPEKGLLSPTKYRDVADRFDTYLRDTYPYSLTFHTEDSSLDPTADFLLNRKSTGGHCEYFASAMVMMCRSVGINARMITGFHGGEFNVLGGYYVVKRKDAHAWAEVFLPGRGWVTYDPSPVGSDPSDNVTVFHWLKDFGDVVQRGWMSAVVAFDNSSRTYLLSLARNFIQSLTSNAKTLADEAVSGFHDIFLAPTTPLTLRTAGIASVLFVITLSGWLIWHWNRRRHSQVERMLARVDRRTQRQLAVDLLFFDDMLSLLGRTGFRKRATQTPREYVDELKSSLGPAAMDAYWLVATFYDIRFGTLRMSGGLRDRIATALQHIRHHISRGQAQPEAVRAD